VIRRLNEFGNVGALWKESRASPGEVEQTDRSEKEIARLEDAQRVFRDLASQMRAFAENEPLAMKLVRRLDYDPMKASLGLTGLSIKYDTYRSQARTPSGKRSWNGRPAPNRENGGLEKIVLKIGGAAAIGADTGANEPNRLAPGAAAQARRGRAATRLA